MDEGRLGAVRKSQSYNRKSVHVMNEIIKNKQDLYQGFLSREEHVTHARLMTDVISAKRNVVRNHVLLQCMEGLREDTASGDATLGVYKGRPIASLTRDIDYLVAQNHPKLRRLRLCKKVKENGFKYGTLLDPSTMRSKVDDFFRRNYVLAQPVDLSLLRLDKEPRNPLTDESKFRYRDPRPQQVTQNDEMAINSVHHAQADTEGATPAQDGATPRKTGSRPVNKQRVGQVPGRRKPTTGTKPVLPPIKTQKQTEATPSK